MGSVVVELFILISGVFFFWGYDRQKEKQINTPEDYAAPYAFLKKRFLRFIPYIVVAHIPAAIVRGWVYVQGRKTIDFNRMLSWFSGDIWELLMVKMNGMNNNSSLLNVPAWTVGAMVMVEFVIFALLVNHEKLFYTLICPCSILIGFGYWRHVSKDVIYNVWIGFTTFGIVRVFISTCLSWYSYKLMKKLQSCHFTNVGRFLLTVCECLLYGLSLYIIFQNYDSRNFRWMIILFFTLAVAITISGHSYTNVLFPSSRWTAYLGELSTGIYLIHCPFWKLYQHLWKDPHEMFTHVGSFLAIVLISAIVYVQLVKFVKQFSSIAYAYMKKACIQT